MIRPAFVLLALLAGGPVAFAETPAELLEKADRALRDYELTGDLVYVHDGRVETLRVERMSGPNGVRERLVTLTGDRRELVRDGAEIRCTQPGLRTVVAALPVLQMLSSSAVASPHYALRIVGEDRVAGLDAVVLEARPRDAARYGYRLWLDKATGVLLQSTLYGANGAPVEQVMFTSITLRPAANAAAPATTSTASAAAPAPREPADWYIDGMPEGFRLVAAPETVGGPRHLVYSDGLANVSVIIEPLVTSGPPLVASERRGAIHLVGRTLGGHQIVVVGDLPAPSIERIASSVAPR